MIYSENKAFDKGYAAGVAYYNRSERAICPYPTNTNGYVTFWNAHNQAYEECQEEALGL